VRTSFSPKVTFALSTQDYKRRGNYWFSLSLPNQHGNNLGCLSLKVTRRISTRAQRTNLEQSNIRTILSYVKRVDKQPDLHNGVLLFFG
ncbi:Hypothetical protein BRZCDTV_102, partial [Brazilian cedratvirus IHUMI]